MTEKKKTTETVLAVSHAPEAVVDAVAADLPAEPKPLSLHGLTAAEALDALRGARAAGRSVLVDAPVGAPRDSVVVEAHHFAGERVGQAWHFHPISLDMACRLAGWRKVERLEPGKVRLS